MKPVKHIVLLDDDNLNAYFVRLQLKRIFRPEPFQFTYISKPNQFIDLLEFMNSHNMEPDLILIDFYLKSFDTEIILNKLNNEFRRYKDSSYLFTTSEKAHDYTFKVLDKSRIGDLNSLLVA